jgi:hypothetical protein
MCAVWPGTQAIPNNHYLQGNDILDAHKIGYCLGPICDTPAVVKLEGWAAMGWWA